jgi:hypothetical protein
VWAPFIPVWEKEWVLPFALGGLLFPEIRRWAALRRYQRQLNDVVARTDAEIARVDLDLLTQWAEPEIARAVDAHDPAEEGREGAVDTAPDAEGGRPRPEASRVKQGGGR